MKEIPSTDHTSRWPASASRTTMVNRPIITLKMGSMMIVLSLLIGMAQAIFTISIGFFQALQPNTFISILNFTSFSGGVLGFMGVLLLAGGYAWYFFSMTPPRHNLLMTACLGLIFGLIIIVFGRMIVPQPTSLEDFIQYLGFQALITGIGQGMFMLSFVLAWRVQRKGVLPIIIYHFLSFGLNMLVGTLQLSLARQPIGEVRIILVLPFFFQQIVNVFGLIAYLYFLTKVDVLKVPPGQRVLHPSATMGVPAPTNPVVPSTLSSPPNLPPLMKPPKKVIQCPSCKARLPLDDEMHFCMECGSPLT